MEHEQVDEILLKQHDKESAKEPKQSEQRRTFIEILVDPRTLQGLMSCGGGLLVLGLIVWLWSIGIFENSKLVAWCLGLGNGALVATGIGLVHRTRHQTAGKAISLLACLLMPLNLWFYDSQGLITLDQGGHLWVPALVCCLIYALVARLLEDAKFVYAIVGGITMTGMLVLADHQVGRLWEIMAPSTFLVILGILCIHIERAFSPGEGPFAREKFGNAFFQAGHIVMASGLALMLGGRLAGRFYEPFLADFGWFDMPAVATQANLKLLALALAFGATYTYIYSQIVVKSRGRYTASAVLTLLWCGVILIDLLAIPFTMELVMLLTAVAGLLLNFSASRIQPTDKEQSRGQLHSFAKPFMEAAPGVAQALNIIFTLLAGILYARARFAPVTASMGYKFDWFYVVAMVVGAISCWMGYRRAKSPQWEKGHLQMAGLAATFLVAALVSCLGFDFSIATINLELLVPLALTAIPLATVDKTKQSAWSSAGSLATLFVQIVGATAILGLAWSGTVDHPRLWLCTFFGIAALNFSLASIHSKKLTSAVLASLNICAVVWQGFILMGVTQHVFIFTTTSAGLVCLVINALIPDERSKTSKFALVSSKFGNWAITVGSSATILLSIARVIAGESDWALLGLLLSQLVAAALSILLTKQTEWRRLFVAFATIEVLLIGLVVNSLSTLSLLQRGELLMSVAGLIMLATGYWGWYRETDKQEDWVSFNLAFGSLLSAFPITVGLLLQRFGFIDASQAWVLMHELGALLIGLGLLATGISCRIRWSTLVGGSSLVLYIVSLVGLIRLPEMLQTTAVYMMIGGGVLFGVTVLLSIYRDRLLAIPQRAQEGEGVFRVLKWR